MNNELMYAYIHVLTDCRNMCILPRKKYAVLSIDRCCIISCNRAFTASTSDLLSPFNRWSRQIALSGSRDLSNGLLRKHKTVRDDSGLDCNLLRLLWVVASWSHLGSAHLHTTTNLPSQGKQMSGLSITITVREIKRQHLECVTVHHFNVYEAQISLALCPSSIPSCCCSCRTGAG